MTSGLRIRNLSKNFGGLQVARNITLDIPTGARAALIGPNGAGKTTFANLIIGALQPSSGSIHLDGKDISQLGEAARVRAGIAKTFQITNLFKDLSVRDNIRLPILEREHRTFRFLERHDGDAAIEAEVEELLADFRLLPLANRLVRSLAYGQQRLVELALTLSLKPRILILDEPAAGVPSSDSHLIVDAIKRLPTYLSVLIIEHDMKLVFEVASRIIVLVNGAVLVEGTPEEISRDLRVRELYLGAGHG
ncbi:ABC transporter ATP-binding protein [Mesorhizobium amorphae]|uniref:Branched-chain amino acid transport system ATP-binding protein n=1 Tax=Mesorhizobium amorphae CCNWGS0123 TaxID=1082933 RepID=G6YFZ5_9HYPH|nr:ABC transporter ATP-binding protein [Mesorhizobium amorphae]ANT54329.1 ABC transporter ATP-binding protein [Mesorhizobium amorphae CCNWGS0123]EHH09349.1 branched-chain amino acid transport system ATP-binding protein [Mesorhizobium amorphae CCNWGS0123]